MTDPATGHDYTVPNARIYLVTDPRGGPVQSFPRERAFDYARNTGHVVARVDTVTDHPAVTDPTDLQAIHDHAWMSIWLHGNWRWLTGNMTTEEKNAVADAVERQWARMEADDPALTHGPESRAALRWWEQ